MMAVQVEDRILKFSVFGYMRLFDDFRSSCLGMRVMLLHIVNEDSQALCSVAELGGSPLAAARMASYLILTSAQYQVER